MIEVKTLEKVKGIQQSLLDCSRKIEDLSAKELVDSGWEPGTGSKPHRVTKLAQLANRTDEIINELDRLWS